METLSERVAINDLCFEKMDYPKDKTLPELFHERVLKDPSGPALAGGRQIMTFKELDIKSDVLAGALINAGVKRETVVGILYEQSVNLIVSMLAVLKSGGAFLIIDPGYPKERINYFIFDSKIGVLVTKSCYLDGLKFAGNVIKLDEVGRDKSALKEGCAGAIKNAPSDLAFVVYTSGSTGRPKAAMVEHRNLINALYYINSKISIDGSSHVLQYFNPSFSASYQEIFISLIFGGTLFIINDDIRRNVNRLLSFISANGINTLFLPVSFLKLIVGDKRFYFRLMGVVKKIVTAGEQLMLPDEFIGFLRESGIEIYNNYGSSETNIAAILNIGELDEISNALPVGRPIANTYVYIMDEKLNMQPIGKTGEIYISGDSVGRGYLNNQLLTGAKFIENPLRPGKLMYRTGDLGKWLPDGNIELSGRIDFQVKIRGFRVELQEVEFNLLKLPHIKEAVVVAKRGEVVDNILYAYIKTDKALKPDDVKKFLRSKIPDYMIPAYIIRLDEFPKTLTGKIDRTALINDNTVLMGENWGSYDSTLQSENIMILFKEITQILENICSIEMPNIRMEDSFTDLGLDSISYLKLIAEIEDRYDIAFDDNEVNDNKFETFKDLILCIAEKRGDLTPAKNR